MEANNVLEIAFGENTAAVASGLYQYDFGQYLKFADIDLPQTYEVHFSNEEHGTAITMIGTESGVKIPDNLLQTGDPVYAWVYLHMGEEDGETEYDVCIFVKARAEPSDEEPTEEEQTAIAQAIVALNNAVTQTGEDVNTVQALADLARQCSELAEMYSEAAGQWAKTHGFYHFEWGNNGELFFVRTDNAADVSFEVTQEGELIGSYEY